MKCELCKKPIKPGDDGWGGRLRAEGGGFRRHWACRPPSNPTAPDKGHADVWCIQVIAGPDREVLEEWWVNPNSNLGYVFPKHGSRHKFWHLIAPGAKYHLTPFTKLERKAHLDKQGKPDAAIAKAKGEQP